MIIGITGTLGSGKGTVAGYLVKEKGFRHFSAREDVINPEILRRGLEINRDNMIDIANDLRRQHDPSYVAEQLFVLAQKTGADCVLESLRAVGEVEALRKKGKFYLLAVDADIRIRYNRIYQRQNTHSDDVTFEKFQEQEKSEMANKDPNKQNIAKCIEMADYVLHNDGSIEDLHEQIEKALAEMSE